MMTTVTETAPVPPMAPPVTNVEVHPPGEIVLDQLRDFLTRFVRFPSQAATDTVTLWIAHTHVLDAEEHLAFNTTPRLAFLSDEPASGKTRALEMVSELAHNGQISVDPTPATFALSIAEKRQTPLIDEIDVLFGAGRSKSVLRSLLNAGYKRKGAYWTRANKPDLAIFAPVAMAGLGSTFRSSDTLSPLRSRTIIIPMKRTRRAEPYRSREHDPMANAIRNDVRLWAERNVVSIIEDWPELPAGIEDRLAEVWEPLLMLANVAGGHWPESAQQAARELALGQNDLEPELPTSAMLMRDLQIVFGGQSKLSSKTIIERLYGLPEPRAPWISLWPVFKAAPRELAALLAPFGIVAGEKVREDGHSLRGYKREAFEPFWANLPPLPVTVSQSLDDDDEDDE